VGATSLFTTVEDLSLWALNFQDPKVGSKTLIEQMNTLAVLNNGQAFGGAYGQFVGPYKGLQQIQHSGGDAGYRSYLCRFPNQDFAVSVVSNSGTSNPGALALQVADLYLKDRFVMEEDSEQETKKTISLSPKQLKALEGNFWNPKRFYSRKIHLKNDSLMYDRGNDFVTPLAPIAENKFIMVGAPTQVTVEFLKEDGQDRMVVVENGEVVAEMVGYTPVDSASVDLKPYLGTYSSEELSTHYTLVEKKGKLVATHSRHSDLPLNLLKPDIFNGGPYNIEFTRDENNSLEGMKVSTGRVQNLWFVKE
ncbi:MAG: serine hydrolase, partial [Aurantibacter sp.]